MCCDSYGFSACRQSPAGRSLRRYRITAGMVDSFARSAGIPRRSWPKPCAWRSSGAAASSHDETARRSTPVAALLLEDGDSGFREYPRARNRIHRNIAANDRAAIRAPHTRRSSSAVHRNPIAAASTSARSLSRGIHLLRGDVRGVLPDGRTRRIVMAAKDHDRSVEAGQRIRARAYVSRH